MKIHMITLLAFSPLLVAAGDVPDPITPDGMRAHIEFLASDALEGRDTGTRGYDVAAQYVASQFLSAGLKPSGTKGWFQPVPFIGMTVDDKTSKATIGGTTFANRTDVLFGPARASGNEKIDGEIVFGGYCIQDLKRGQNDFKGLQVRGKVVACLTGFPKGMKSDVGAHYGRMKGITAQRNGIIGIINVRTLEADRLRSWALTLDAPRHPSLWWATPEGMPFSESPAVRFGLTVHGKAADALFAGAPVALANVLAEADKDGGRPKGFALKSTVTLERTSTKRTFTSPNVIGMLLGSDPALAGEAVLMMAHLDHEGVDTARQGDQIFNGAMDNASGTATLIEAARALVAGPRPKRTILFAAVAAEERGLLGSDYLARHNVLPEGGKVVAVVNLDMPVLLYDFKDVIAFGAEHSTLGPIVARASERVGVSLSPDPIPSEGLFTRSDHYSFVKQGVPSIFLMTGFQNGGEKAFRDFLKTHYHRVSDEPTLPFDWNAAAKFARVNTEIAREIANMATVPAWYTDSFFGAEFAPTAPKAKR